jgi:lipopolysaccharide transport system permease protein
MCAGEQLPPAAVDDVELRGEAPEEAPDDMAVTVIERRSGWQLVNWRELYYHRELLFYLAWRDVKVRYKQTALGVAWAVLQPLSTMIVFAFFLGRLGGVSDGMANYPLFVFAGVLPWTFFANAVTAAGNSIVNNENLVSKIYFPRLAMPLSAVGASLFDFLIGLVLLAILAAWYHTAPGWGILLAPVIMVLLMVTAAGVGTLLAALIVAQRDFRHVLVFAVQLWMFATPCIYLRPTMVMGPRAELALPLNPAYGLILNFRRAVLGGELDWYALGCHPPSVCCACWRASCFSAGSNAHSRM